MATKEALEVDNSGARSSMTRGGAREVRRRLSNQQTESLIRALTSQITLDRCSLMGQEVEDRGNISTTTATLTLIGAMIGAGIMALPQLPAKGGVYATCAFSSFAALCSWEAGLVFFDTMRAHNDAARAEGSDKRNMETFEDFGREGMGAVGAAAARVSVTIWFLGLCSGYVILLAQQLDGLTGEFAESSFLGRRIPYRMLVAIVAVPLWSLAMKRDVGAIAELMPLATVAGVVSCALIIGIAVSDAQCWEEWPEEEQARVHYLAPPENASFMTMASVCATLSGAYAAVANLPSVANEMEHQSQFPCAWSLTMALVTMLYLCIMLCGHFGYGSFVQDSIVDSMTYNPANFTETQILDVTRWTGPRAYVCPAIMCVCVMVNLVLSYPLNMMCIFVAVQSSDYGRSALKVGTTANYIMRTVFCSFTFMVAFVMQKFGDVFAVFASVCGPFMCVFCVLVFARNIRKTLGLAEYPPWRSAFHILMLIFGTFCLVFGFIDSAGAFLKDVEAAKTTDR